MHKDTLNSEALLESFKKQRELATEQAERISKLTPEPSTITASISGLANLGNTLKVCFCNRLFCCRTLVS